MCHVWPNVHQVRDAVAALPFGIAFKQFAHLEEQHDEHRLRKLCLSSWQEADAQRADGGDSHQEVLVEHVSLGDALPGLPERFVPN